MERRGDDWGGDSFRRVDDGDGNEDGDEDNNDDEDQDD